MWLQLLTSKDEVAEAIKKFKARAEAESGKKCACCGLIGEAN